MRIIRFLGNVALWLGALLGVVAGGVWAAGQFDLIQPLIVISGSMEPGIHTGDLLLDTWQPTADVSVGDVLSLPSELTGKRVTHRVVSVEPAGNGWEIHMKGDANDEDDLEPYLVGDEVLTPWIQIPMAGKVVAKVMEPSVAMPILLALLALLGLSMLDEPPRQLVRRVIDRVRQRDPRIDELDAELAAVGIDVGRLQEMDDLDLQLYALGVDVPAAPSVSAPAVDVNEAIDDDAVDNPAPASRNNCGVEDGLWAFEMPPSDGLGLVRTYGGDLPRTLLAPYDPLLPAALSPIDQRTPARSG